MNTAPIPSFDEAVRGLRRQHRDALVHTCGEPSIVRPDVAALLARQAVVISAIPCCQCRQDRPVAEFHFRTGQDLV